MPRWTDWGLWWRVSAQEGQAKERSLLEAALGRRGVSFETCDTVVGKTSADYIHSIHAPGSGASRRTHLVCLPGYGVGAAIFFRNLPVLAPQVQTHAVDWRGAGLSGRPPFTSTSGDEVVDWFVEGLEAWRAQRGLEKFVLFGHSMGGIIAAHYAKAHPTRVEHLILCGPAAMAERPELPPKASKPYPRLQATVENWWEGGLTPGKILRRLGPFGPSLMRTYVSGRFREGHLLSVEEQELFGTYAYEVLAQPPCAEQCLNLLLQPGAWARKPLGPVVEALQWPPVSWIYGESDWMRPTHGQASASRMQDQGKSAECFVVPHAGHYSFLDRPDICNEIILRICKQVSERRQ
mmetsp:Transcript_59003/g.140896  ORF Transcript_59003/g.140896 Transcript_59003/m.140896 type:complete len:350 (-) Transcript_59003:14-1063(-)